jgi:hypothetical protein
MNKCSEISGGMTELVRSGAIQNYELGKELWYFVGLRTGGAGSAGSRGGNRTTLGGRGGRGRRCGLKHRTTPWGKGREIARKHAPTPRGQGPFRGQRAGGASADGPAVRPYLGREDGPCLGANGGRNRGVSFSIFECFELRLFATGEKGGC